MKHTTVLVIATALALAVPGAAFGNSVGVRITAEKEHKDRGTAESKLTHRCQNKFHGQNLTDFTWKKGDKAKGVCHIACGHFTDFCRDGADDIIAAVLTGGATYAACVAALSKNCDDNAAKQAAALKKQEEDKKKAEADKDKKDKKDKK